MNSQRVEALKSRALDALRIHSDAEPTLVLGSSPDIRAGRLGLQTVRRGGFRRTVAVYGTPAVRTVVEENTGPRLLSAGVGALAALVVVAIYVQLNWRSVAFWEAAGW